MRRAYAGCSAFGLLCLLRMVVQLCNGDDYDRSMTSQSDRGDVLRRMEVLLYPSALCKMYERESLVVVEAERRS